MEKSKTDKSFHAASLILKHLRGEPDSREVEELEIWKQENDRNRQLFESLTNPAKLKAQLEVFEKTVTETGWKRLQDKMAAERKEKRKALRKIWWQSAAAIFILGLATWQIGFHKANNPPAEATMISQYGQDIQPGTSKARLILSDGSTVRLDNKGDTSFTENGTTIQRRADGTIQYKKGNSNNGKITWNTLHIPRAGEYMILLEDGTKVWLNSASSLRYPVQFTGRERRVELLEGEAYFEVAKNKEKPFIVVADKMEIQAVGTAFNVNMYQAEAGSMSAMLTEGKVKVATRRETVFLMPGEQAELNRHKVQTARADVEEVTAWKNGLFIFNKMPLQQALQQVARWYDVEIEYDKGFTEPKFITGEIKRNVPVSKLLQMMELTGIARSG